MEIKNEENESRINLTDQAVVEAQERIKSKLESVGINTKEISNESLIILDKLTRSEADADLFPEIILDKASEKIIEETMKDNPSFNDELLTHKASIEREYVDDQTAFDTPEEKQAYVKEFSELHPDEAKDEIMKNPNKYYTEEFFPEEARLDSAQDQANI